MTDRYEDGSGILLSRPEIRHDEPEFLRIREREYLAMREEAEKIQVNTDAPHTALSLRFMDRMTFPTEEDLIVHDVRHYFRQYLPYLIYYRDVFQSDSPIWEKAHRALERIFSECLDVIAACDYEPLEKTDASCWKKSTKEQKADLLRPVVRYYGINEYESFRQDLGWIPLMRAYSYGVKAYRQKYPCPELEKEFQSLWDEIQNEPVRF